MSLKYEPLSPVLSGPRPLHLPPVTVETGRVGNIFCAILRVEFAILDLTLLVKSSFSKQG